MKTFLIIQGEGRGHISQSITYCQNNPDLEIIGIIISNQREIPKNLLSYFGDIPIFKLNSFSFILENGGINYFKSFIKNIIMLPFIIFNIFKTRNIIKKFKPELILNFYEPLSIGTYKLNSKKVSIANQYLFYTKEWKYPYKNLNYFIIKMLNNLTSFGSNEIVAPSFINIKSNNKVSVIDPLIREEIKKSKPKKKNYTLVYLIDEYILKEFSNYANKNLDKKFILFCDHSFYLKNKFPKNVKYYKLDIKNFTHHLINCKDIIATAGFQLICESLYLNKDIKAIPVHYEQEINVFNLNKN